MKIKWYLLPYRISRKAGYLCLIVEQEQMKCFGEDSATPSAERCKPQLALSSLPQCHRTLEAAHIHHHPCFFLSWPPDPPSWVVESDWLRLGCMSQNGSQFGGGEKQMAFSHRRRGALPPMKIHIAKAASFLGRRFRCQTVEKNIKCTLWLFPDECTDHL